MKKVTFITWNLKKAENLRKYLGMPIEYASVELDEIQSLDLREVTEHKARQAFWEIGSPVLVEDASLEFTELGRLPGTFIKFFVDEAWVEKLCKMIWKNRGAIAKTTFCYYDGNKISFFEWYLDGSIAPSPRWNNWFAWDQIFIPHWSDKTSAELDEYEYEKFYLQVKPIRNVWEFLKNI